MKLKSFILIIILQSIFLNAYSQSKIPQGAPKDTLWNRGSQQIDSNLKLVKYSSDSLHALFTDARGNVFLKTVQSSGFYTLPVVLANGNRDTTGTGIYLGNRPILSNTLFSARNAYINPSASVRDFLSNSTVSITSGTTGITFFGGVIAPTIANTNTSNWTNGVVGLLVNATGASGGTGTLGECTGINIGGDNFNGFHVLSYKGMDIHHPVTSNVIDTVTAFAINDQAIGTNNTLLLLGTLKPVGGNHTIYNVSTYDNYLGDCNNGISTSSPVSKLHIGSKPIATSNYGTISMGLGAFNGVTSGFFTGSASGTHIAINEQSAGVADFSNYQVAGVSKFKIDNSGNETIAGTMNSSGTGSSSFFLGTGSIGIGNSSPETGTTMQISTPSTAGSGTISVTASSGAITGSGTTFLLTFNVGDTIFANSETHVITTLTSNTSMTTDVWTSPFSGSYTLGTRTNMLRVYQNGQIRIGQGSIDPVASNSTYISISPILTNPGTTNGLQVLPNIIATSNTANQFQAINGQLTVNALNTANWTNVLNAGISGKVVVTGANSGTLTAVTGVRADISNASSGGLTISNAYGVQVTGVAKSNSGVITNAAAYTSVGLSTAANNTYLLMGTNTIPSNNWAAYFSTSFNNYLGTGNTLINSTTDNATDKLQVTGSAYISSLSAGGMAKSVSGQLRIAIPGTDYLPGSVHNLLIAQTTAVSSVTAYTPLATAEFMVGAYLNVTAVVTDVIKVSVSFFDETGNSQTKDFFAQGLTSASVSSVSNNPYPPMIITAGTGGPITILTTLTTGIGTITYNVSGTITKLD